MSYEIRRLRHALETMPDDDRRVFERARFEDQDYAEIARALGLDILEVEQRMAAAMLHMARALAADP